MELRVNDYVRTKKHGIGKIISFSYQEDDECCFIELSKRRTGIKQSNIIKSSPNIIDILEVGDYVNGREIDFIDEDGLYSDYNNADYYYYKKEDIKSIVTKEQFKNMEYEVR